MTAWVITGRNGQLGSCLEARISARSGAAPIALSRAELDLGAPGAVDAWFDANEAGLAADAVFVNAAAYTAVDRAEEEEELAARVNGEAPGRMAERCRARGVRFVHVSTDYVFDGAARAPYAVDAKPAPVTAYGRTKLLGERAVLDAMPEALVVRTSWVFGPGKNFVLAILRQAALRRRGEVSGPLTVVDDQRGCPTYADDLAEGLLGLVDAGASGLHHLSNADAGGGITWRDFARAILEETGHGDLPIDPITTESLALPAHRPAYSVLDASTAAAHGVALRDWRDALRAYLKTVDLAATAEAP